jgi:hypothetical protein
MPDQSDTTATSPSASAVALLPKPLYGDPCNGCGLCCIAQQCDISVALFGEQEICPAIERAGHAIACGLVRSTADYVPDMTAWGGKTLTEAFALMLGAGAGCDGSASDQDEAREAEYRPIIRAKAEAAIAAASEDAQALLAYFRQPPPLSPHRRR